MCNFWKHMISICLILGAINSYHLPWMDFPGFSIVRLFSLCFVSINWWVFFLGDLWRKVWDYVNILFLIIFLSTNCSIHWWFLLKQLHHGVCQMVIFYVHHFFFIYELKGLSFLRHLFIQSCLYFNMDLGIFTLYFGLYSITTLFCCSNCSSCSHGLLFQDDSWIPLTCPHPFILWAFPSFWCHKMLQARLVHLLPQSVSPYCMSC